MFGLRTFSLDPELVSKSEVLESYLVRGLLERRGSSIAPTLA